ncbi:MAG: restriction endonuclease [Betaproteobacteria bacterium HGW-Betaproteobacteria-6]|jgi:D-arabinose 5-phosphate isomerase GutQ|nr:MAG: restriction endonuclease [Betaproteobacteria bacterium HGW-Betaproteobacteria-6]
MKKIRKNQSVLNLPTLRLEGSLFLPDQLEKAALGRAAAQGEADYHTPKGLKLKDDYSRAFQIASAQWKHFASQLERSDVDAATVTRQFTQELLRDAFGYASLAPASAIHVGDRHYPVHLIAGLIPVIVAPHTLGLDDPDPCFAIAGSGSRKKSAFQLAQELLNASPDHLWALVTNGRQLRLLRDAATLTRPSFLEIDLQDILAGARYAEFANAWRLLHASRAGIAPAETATNNTAPCIWEAWRETGQQEGTRVRDGLRQGVTEALLIFGEGFLQHPANDALRASLFHGQLEKDAYFQQLLRLIYRLIFLFNVEERGVLHGADDSKDAQTARRAYREGYATSRLRDLCLKRRARNRFDDHWQALRIVFKGLCNGEPRLALPALGGLFGAGQCPALDSASIDNAHLLAALQNLRWSNLGGSLAPIDYRNMGPEELGSVYESLLELVPEIDLSARHFGFVGLTSEGSTAGNARKLTGSYYTPDALVQELIKSALDPVIEQRLAAQPENPSAAVLAIRVIDPACGSGHFLLAAARRLAERLALLRAPEGAVKPQDYRHALREVISCCIFGVDRNPMAVELARTALWLEGFEEGRPLSFLDHHLQVGDALLGLTDLKALEFGIAKDAFKPLSGDDKEVCKVLGKANAAALKDLGKKRVAQAFGQLDVTRRSDSGLAALQAIDALPVDTPAQIAAKESAYSAFLQQAKDSHLAHAADLAVGTYLLPKTAEQQASIPSSATLYLALTGEPLSVTEQAKLTTVQAACRHARVFHWPLAFPQVFAAGGFDCVLGNPPWERIKLQEEEFFATRHRDVFAAKNKAERSQRIQWLAEGMLAKHLFPKMEHVPHECTAELRLYAEFIAARRTAEAASVFAHVKGDDGGRYPLTGVGDVNTYALFAETISQITAASGRAGFIVPTGIATDDSTKAYFSHLTQKGMLVSLLAFENEEFIFPAVHHSFRFCLLTLGKADQAEFVFFARRPEQIHDQRRHFTLTPDEFRLINPNTLTCPVFRSEHDAVLTKKLYRTAPVLIDENRLDGNPWGISIRQGIFHLTNDINDGVIFDANAVDIPDGLTPVTEGKLLHQFDHRWATYDRDGSRDITVDEKNDPNFTATPRYWVAHHEVEQRLNDKGWTRGWLIGWRDITSAHVLRTVIASVVPRVGVAYTFRIVLTLKHQDSLAACLLANMNSLALDFVARQVLGGTHLSDYVAKQFPILPPDRYTEADLTFIVPRVLELTYTAHDLTAWATDLGYTGAPFAFDPDRRAILLAELDAYYAKLYALTRDELRYILDPADVLGEDYPSETFRVLKNKELKEFGEYRTQNLVLREFDRMDLSEANGAPFISLLNPPPGERAQPSYSAHGVIKDEIDAYLTGLLLTMIRLSGRLPRRDLIQAVTMASQPALLLSFADAQSAGLIDNFQRRRPSIFDATRLTGDRVHNWLRHFESTGLIRMESQTDELIATPGASIPSYVLMDGETARVATALTLAVAQASARVTIDEVQATDVSVKRA